MADVRITFSPDRAAAAERLREAVSAEGYPVALAEISDVASLIESEDQPKPGGATLLIWSRPLVLSALRPGLLRKLRQQRNLIEVSPDGVGPDGGEGDSHVILISGWRGQPFHPGWQRLASELARVCGAPKQALETFEGLGSAAATAAPQAPPAEARQSSRRPQIARMALAVLAGAGLFAAGFAVSSWVRPGASGPQAPPQAAMRTDEAERAPVAADRRVPPGRATLEPADPSSLSRPAPSTPAALEPGSGMASSEAAPPSPAARNGSKTAARKANRDSETRRTKGGSQARGETKRYSRRNSEVMRLFCRGSGRSTPQCRTFLRSTRGSRR